MNRSRPRRPSRTILAAWLLGLLAALAALSRFGSDHPGSPPLTEPARWSEWWWSREPIDAAAGVARLAAMASILYLVVVTAALLSAAVLAGRSRRSATRRRSRSVLRGIGWLAPRFVLGLTTSAVLAAPTIAGATTLVRSPGPSAPDTPGATMERLTDGRASPRATDGSASAGTVEPAPSGAPGTDVVSAERTGTVADRRDTWLPWAAPVDGGPRLDPAILALTEPMTNPTDRATSDVVVQPGDHLWGIAASEMSFRLGRPATSGETYPYWRALIEANRDRLADRENPDLIFPGQALVLP